MFGNHAVIQDVLELARKQLCQEIAAYNKVQDEYHVEWHWFHFFNL